MTRTRNRRANESAHAEPNPSIRRIAGHEQTQAGQGLRLAATRESAHRVSPDPALVPAVRSAHCGRHAAADRAPVHCGSMTESQSEGAFPYAAGRLDAKRRIVGGANELARVLRVGARDLEGRCLDDLVSRRDRVAVSRYCALLAELVEGGTGSALVSLTRGGATDSFLLDLSRVGDGWRVTLREAGAGSVLHDLVVSQERWRGLLRGSDSGIAVLDPDGRLVDFNDSFPALMRLRANSSVRHVREAVRGRPLFSLPIDPALRELRACLATLRRSQELSVDLAGRKLNITATPLWISDRSCGGTCLVVRDETPREMMAELARDAARVAGKAEVATGVLHSIGNALCSVRTSSSVIGELAHGDALDRLDRLCMLLGDQEDLPGFVASPRGRKVVEYLRAVRGAIGQEQASIMREVSSLQESVEEIARAVAVQQRHAAQDMETQPCNADDLVASSLGMVRKVYDKDRIAVVRRGEPSARILTDRYWVVRVLSALLRNAARAIRGAVVAQGCVVVSQRATAEEWIVDVTDNGVGFPPGDEVRLFRCGVGNALDESGFGLHDCANACRALGGSLAARSDGPGRGATFTVRIPRTPATVERRPPDAAGPGPSAARPIPVRC